MVRLFGWCSYEIKLVATSADGTIAAFPCPDIEKVALRDASFIAQNRFRNHFHLRGKISMSWVSGKYISCVDQGQPGAVS
jgi:hypothetical protein